MTLGKSDKTDDLRERVMAQFLALPSPLKEAEDLTDQEKLALCIVAGCKTETFFEGNIIRVRTVNPVGVVKLNGKFQVCEYRGA